MSACRLVKDQLGWFAIRHQSNAADVLARLPPRPRQRRLGIVPQGKAHQSSRTVWGCQCGHPVGSPSGGREREKERIRRPASRTNSGHDQYMAITRAVALFIAAGLAEIGGGYLVWRWLRDGAPVIARTKTTRKRGRTLPRRGLEADRAEEVRDGQSVGNGDLTTPSGLCRSPPRGRWRGHSTAGRPHVRDVGRRWPARFRSRRAGRRRPPGTRSPARRCEPRTLCRVPLLRTSGRQTAL